MSDCPLKIPIRHVTNKMYVGTYNVILRRIGLTIIAMEKQKKKKLQIQSVCL